VDPPRQSGTSRPDAADPDPLEAILSLADAARLSGLSAHTLTQQAERGKLRARKLGHTWVTTEHWLAEYLALHARRKTDQR
jgi:hypothetical protein